MQPKTQGVSLREVLRHAFASLPERGATACEAIGPAPVVVPVKRTSVDRSRMRQKVLEELARRRQQSEEAPGAAPVADAATTQANLFERAEEPHAAGSGSPAPSSIVRGPQGIRRDRTDVRDLVDIVYRSLFRRLPEDHVVLNPQANAEFIVRCRDLGATVSDVVLNRTLLNNRKACRHADVLREHVPSLAPHIFDRIGHAVEIAASLVQREWVAVGHATPSVDDILCNPDLRRSFDVYVSALQEDADVVDSRLALLAFRKSGREAAGRHSDIDLPERSLYAPLRTLDPDDVRDRCGVYQVLCKRRPVFVSATADLRRRLRQHLQRGGAAFLPATIPFEIDGPVSVRVFNLPSSSPRSVVESLARRLRFAGTEGGVPTPPDLNWRATALLFGLSGCIAQRRRVAAG